MAMLNMTSCRTVVIIVFYLLLVHLEDVSATHPATSPTCPSNAKVLSTCGFDTDFCVYSTISSDSGGLEWKRGQTLKDGATTLIGPDWQPAGTLPGRQSGHFVYLDVGDGHVPVGSKARFQAHHVIGDVMSICVKFHYATTSRGKLGHAAEISLYNQMTSENGGKITRVVGHVKRDTKGDWFAQTISACVWSNSSLYFEAGKLSPDNWVAIDHVTISESSMDCYCTKDRRGLPSCTFDTDICGVYSNHADDPNLVWRQANSVPGNRRPLIEGDYEPPNRSKKRRGKFIYLDVGNQKAKIGSKSRLKAKILGERVTDVCMDFRYLTTGTGSRVNVYIQDSHNNPSRLIGWIDDVTRGEWKVATFTTQVNLHSSIVFESEKLSPTSYVALDYIDVRRWIMYKPTTTAAITTTTSTTTTTTTTATISSSSTISKSQFPTRPSPLSKQVRSTRQYQAKGTTQMDKSNTNKGGGGGGGGGGDGGGRSEKAGGGGGGRGTQRKGGREGTSGREGDDEKDDEEKRSSFDLGTSEKTECVCNESSMCLGLMLACGVLVCILLLLLLIFLLWYRKRKRKRNEDGEGRRILVTPGSNKVDIFRSGNKVDIFTPGNNDEWVKPSRNDHVTNNAKWTTTGIVGRESRSSRPGHLDF